MAPQALIKDDLSQGAINKLTGERFKEGLLAEVGNPLLDRLFEIFSL